jgi:hypothetical protein
VYSRMVFSSIGASGIIKLYMEANRINISQYLNVK